MNSNLEARIITKHGFTRKIKIADSIRQGGILSVIEYATMIDEIAEELEKITGEYKSMIENKDVYYGWMMLP